MVKSYFWLKWKFSSAKNGETHTQLACVGHLDNLMSCWNDSLIVVHDLCQYLDPLLAFKSFPWMMESKLVLSAFCLTCFHGRSSHVIQGNGKSNSFLMFTCRTLSNWGLVLVLLYGVFAGMSSTELTSHTSSVGQLCTWHFFSRAHLTYPFGWTQ